VTLRPIFPATRCAGSEAGPAAPGLFAAAWAGFAAFAFTFTGLAIVELVLLLIFAPEYLPPYKSISGPKLKSCDSLPSWQISLRRCRLRLTRKFDASE
jgi:hypothetical protein